MSAKPPKTPIDCWAPATPPAWVLMGMDRLMEGSFLTFACSSCRAFFSVPEGHTPHHACRKRAKSTTQPGKLGAR